MVQVTSLGGFIMSTTSLLYHAFGVRGYQLVRTDYPLGEVVFTIGQKRASYRCAACGSKEVIAHGSKPRLWDLVPIGQRRVRLFFAVPRVECRRCLAVRQVRLTFADPKRPYTHQLERYVLELSRHMTIQDVARHLGLSWDTVKDIQKRYLTKKYAAIPLRRLRQIAIDEIAVASGHRYFTVVLDLQTGAVVYLGDGKGMAALRPFFEKLKAAHAQIAAVATDLAAAYVAAIRQHLPGAVHVFDRFHVIKLYNEKLSAFRRQLYHQLDPKQKKLLKGTRWLLLKNPENLDDQKNERRRLAQALTLNRPLARAYYLKEDLRQFWEQPSRSAARRHLEHWVRKARAAGVAMLAKFADTLSFYRPGLLAWYDYPISTGPLEGTNNKIRTLQRQAYGFRDLEFFKLKIYHLHQTKYAFVG
jgi:transposase